MRSSNAASAAGVPHARRRAHPTEYARLVAMIADHDYLSGEVIRMDGALACHPAEERHLAGAA
ncbi:hypothetical protein C6Y14_00155 [Streptomyces dioscori]|uniref:Short-chain dehydrogenase n=1 Tax=Streptomyces dioscori TaxID=2109333 RepID=A0A2P8QEE5_9ACTN|nr:hypothetical protein [Streptomyces dioscori]PSM44604.1 hypothetical protein C6Y14_00155 [Streptomyces dioscori]